MDAKGESKTCADGGAAIDAKDRPHLNEIENFSKSSKDLFIRADKVDLRSLDIQLEKTLSKIWLKERSPSGKPKEEWEIDPSTLEMRYIIAHGTYGTVYRGIYGGQDVAGAFFTDTCVNFQAILFIHFLQSA